MHPLDICATTGRLVDTLLTLAPQGDINSLLVLHNLRIDGRSVALLHSQPAMAGEPLPISPGFSAPEVYWGEAMAETPVYFVGALMYRLLTGKTPQEAPLREEAHNLLATHAPLASLINRAAAVQPAARFANLQALRQALLQEYQQQKALAQRPAAPIGFSSFGPPAGKAAAQAPKRAKAGLPQMQPQAAIVDGKQPEQAQPLPAKPADALPANQQVPPARPNRVPPVGVAGSTVQMPENKENMPDARAEKLQNAENKDVAEAKATAAPIGVVTTQTEKKVQAGPPEAAQAEPQHRAAAAQAAFARAYTLRQAAVRPGTLPFVVPPPPPGLTLVGGQPFGDALPPGQMPPGGWQAAARPGDHPLDGRNKISKKKQKNSGINWRIRIGTAAAVFILLVLIGGFLLGTHLQQQRLTAAFNTGDYAVVLRVLRQTPWLGNGRQQERAYSEAQVLLPENPDGALLLLDGLGEYGDSAQLATAVRYQQAEALLQQGALPESLALYQMLDNYKDSRLRCRHITAYMEAAALTDPMEQYRAFYALDGFLDSALCAERAARPLYEQAMANYTAGQVEEAEVAFVQMDGYLDAADYARACGIFLQAAGQQGVGKQYEAAAGQLEALAALATKLKLAPLLMRDPFFMPFLEGEWQSQNGRGSFTFSYGRGYYFEGLEVRGTYYFTNGSMASLTGGPEVIFRYQEYDRITIQVGDGAVIGFERKGA